MREFNPHLWFGKRELDHVPPYFTKATTPITYEKLEWVKTKLTGRYVLVKVTSQQQSFAVFEETQLIYFEDPKEATFYELRWSGTKNN